MNESVAGLKYQSVSGSSLISVTEDGKDARKVSIPELFMIIAFKLSKNGEAQIKAQTEKMQANNAVVSALNDKISKLSALQAYVPPDQTSRKKLSDLIKDSSEDAKNFDKAADDFRKKAESSHGKYQREAGFWESRGYVNAMSVAEARDPNTPRWKIEEALKNAGIIKVDDKGKISQPSNLNNNIDRMREHWADYSHYASERDRNANAAYGIMKEPIKQAFLGLGSFPTEPVRNADGELQRNPDGSLQLGGQTINLLENFKVKTHGNPIDDIEINGADLDALITHLKGKIESYNSQSQLDMIDLQKFVSENNRYFDMASNMISKGAQSLQSIVGNIRG